MLVSDRGRRRLTLEPEKLASEWIVTFSGKRWFFDDPNPSVICIEDVAHHTSNICRYTGAPKDFYSVAEHCVLLANHVLHNYTEGEAAKWKMKDRMRWAREILLHDAAETYYNDMSRPLKNRVPDYKTEQKRGELVVANVFGLTYPEPAWLKDLDSRIVFDEYEQAMPQTKLWLDFADLGGLGVKLKFWLPRRAEREFLDTYNFLTDTLKRF